VPADRDMPRGRSAAGTDRTAAFSDGVFAVAATLLAWDVAVHRPGTPLQRVLHGWPGHVAYVASFLTIGGAWLLHTALAERLTGQIRSWHLRHIPGARRRITALE
jgi:uncharacterized membrane protein